MTDLFEDLAWRGLIHQETNPEGLRAHLAEGSRRLYAGFDPTAPSLTIGNLVAVLLLRRFQDAGHRPVVVMGGGTGLIGDPSGKESERPVMTRETIAEHVAGQRPIFERLLSFEGPSAAAIRNNADWLEKLSFIEVLRDVGKHFSVNMMIQKDSVRERLQKREQGISYTEFSYMLLQAYDFQHLFENEGVTVQVAGSDQWGNIVAGIDLIRRTRQVETFGLTAPLVTKADGGKFGKTEKGAIWLTADRTSPYAFYQFWLNTADADIERFLKIFTLLPRAEIERLVAVHQVHPERRAAHRALAAHVTRLMHGSEALEQAETATHALFGEDHDDPGSTGPVGSASSGGSVSGAAGSAARQRFRALSRQTLDDVFEAAPTTELAVSELEPDGLELVDVLVRTGAAKSKRQAREFLSNGAVLLNGDRVELGQRITRTDLLHDAIALIRRGRKHWFVVRCV